MTAGSDAGTRVPVVTYVTAHWGVCGVGLVPPPRFSVCDFRIGAGVGVVTPAAAMPGTRVSGTSVSGIALSRATMSTVHRARFPARIPGGARVYRTTFLMGGSPKVLLPPAMVLPVIPPAAIRADVRIQFVRLPAVAGNVAPQGLRFLAALLGLLPKTGGVYLGLLGVGTGPRGFSLPFAGVNFHILRFPADISSLFPVLLVALLLHGLPALSPGEEQHHNQRHDNNGNDHPYPWGCIHVSHHFPLRCDRAGPRHSGRHLFGRL